MNIKTPNGDNFKICKLPIVKSNNHNKYIIHKSKRTNNCKKKEESNNIDKLSGSYHSKTNYKFKLFHLGTTLEVNKNNLRNDSYQNQRFGNQNINNKEKKEISEGKEIIVKKTNLRKIKMGLDKNKSFMVKNDKREMSFNKREYTPALMKHMSVKSKNKSNKSSNNNNYYKNTDNNSVFSLLETNNQNNSLGIKPNYLQYDFSKLKINRHSLNSQFININCNINIHNKNDDEIFKENINTNNISDNNQMNNIHNIKNISNKNKGVNNNNNNNNFYVKINNNLHNLNNNNHNYILYLKNQKSTNNDEFFSEKEEKEIDLTKEEKSIYGNRIMKNYVKTKLLGKGGCGIVWLCYKNNPNDEYAVKQISKKLGNNSSILNLNINEENLKIARNEIKILKMLNDRNIMDENKYISCDVIPRLYEFYEDNNDIWFSFEKGGKSLSGLSYKIKGEFEKGERIYHIQKGIFLKLLFSNIKQFKYFIKQILSGIDFINSNGIVHSDIKPENILIEYNNDDKNFEITSIKIIDYGSAFYYENTSDLSSNTPEYLCPEITHSNKKFLKDLSSDKKYINCIDIWSFGITLLELCLCVPIWMSYKSKVLIKGKSFYSIGYFGCKGRDGNKIYQKQLELSKNLEKILKNSLLYLLEKDERNKFVNLLSGLLEFDYRKRISIKEALNHEFFKDENEDDE